MQEYIIKSFKDLSDLVFSECYDEKINRYRDNYVYRGASDINFTLISKLNRICSHDLSLESSINRSFLKYGYTDTKDCESFWQVLALGQHYGLPTRLLDWTYSPLVAAHFATEDIYKYDVDGVIYRISMNAGKKRLPKCLIDELDKTSAQSFTLSMLDAHAKDLESFKALSAEPFFVFFEPASQTDRMTNQYALFSMTSDPSYSIVDLLSDDPIDTLTKIVIPKEVKLEIRDKLDYINVSERLIYPGLDGICSWITRRYADLGSKYNLHED